MTKIEKVYRGLAILKEQSGATIAVEFDEIFAGGTTTFDEMDPVDKTTLVNLGVVIRGRQGMVHLYLTSPRPRRLLRLSSSRTWPSRAFFSYNNRPHVVGAILLKEIL